MDEEIRDDVSPEDESSAGQAAEPEETSAFELGNTAELTAIEESLDGELEVAAVEERTDGEAGLEGAEQRVGDEDEGMFSDETSALLDAYTPEPGEVPVDSVPSSEGAADVSAEAPLPPIDLGPERRSNLWVWVGLLVGVLIAAAAIGYAWWYATSRPIVVPDVTGKLPAQATQTLNDLGLRLGKVSEVPTDTAPAGTVISQSPAAMEELKPDAQVSLVLAAPPETSKVPDVAGKSFDEAASVLSAARLTPKRVDSYAATVAADYVISQLPTAGVSLAPGGVVALVVSRGPAPTAYRVPQLTGLPEQDAATLLAPLDVTVLAYRSVNNSIPVGVVVTQSPVPGSQVPVGGGIQYLVSSGAGVAPVTVPNVSGDSQKDAEAALKVKGLKPQVNLVTSTSVAKGVVISQMPAAGTRVASGGTVGLLVSKGNLTQGSVPNLAGKSSEEASKAVTAAGFRSVVVEIGIAGYPAGQVFMQFPAAKTGWPLRFPVVCVVAKAS